MCWKVGNRFFTAVDIEESVMTCAKHRYLIMVRLINRPRSSWPWTLAITNNAMRSVMGKSLYDLLELHSQNIKLFMHNCRESKFFVCRISFLCIDSCQGITVIHWTSAKAIKAVPKFKAVWPSHSYVSYYHPQTKLWKGNVFTSVCQEFCPQGGLSQHALGQTPRPVHAGIHTPPCPVHVGMHPPGQTPPCPVHAEIHTALGRHPPGQTHPLRIATAADGTHPTGMHSCLERALSGN